MASLSDARFSLPDPQVAVSRVTAPVDQSTAQAIEAFGKLGGEARKGFLEGTMINDLQETGDIINTINAGESAVQEAVRKKQIDPTNERFQRLAAATNQGKISEQRAAIEAEVILRESIAKAPGFADTFRQTARETLGFDPTSASLNALFLSGPDAKSSVKTQAEKDIEQADAMLQAGAVESIEQGVKLINQARVGELRQDIQSQRIANGELNAGAVAVEGANRTSNAINGIMVAAIAEIRNTGGVQDPEILKNAIISIREQEKSKIENEMAGNDDNLYNAQSYRDVRNRIDEVADAYVTLVDNQDFQKVLSRNQDILQNLSEVAAISIAPDLAVLAPFGESAMQSYLELQAASQGDPRIMQELMISNPQYRFLGDITLKATDVSAGLKAHADRILGQEIQAGNIDRVTGQAVAMKEGLDLVSGRTTPDDVGGIIDNLAEVGMPVMSLSTAAQTGNSYSRMGEDDRGRVAQNFNTTNAQQVDNVTKSLAGTGFNLDWNGREFVVVDAAERSISEIDFTAPQTFASEARRQSYTSRRLAQLSGTTEQLDLLNDTMLPLTKDVRWANQFGYNDANDWATKTLNSVNVGLAANDLQTGEGLNNQLGLKDQAALRTAFRSGDIEQAIEVLTNAQARGFGGVEGIQSAAITEGVVEQGGGRLIRDAAGLVTGSTFDPAGVQQTAGFEADPNTLGFEGFRAKEYIDPAGIRTIGFGHNLEANPLTPEQKQTLGIDPNLADSEIELSEDQARQLFRMDAEKILPNVEKAVPNFRELPRGAQKALLDMGINIGAAGLRGFKKMIDALKNNDLDTAAAELLDSQYGRGHIKGPDGKIITDENGEPRVFRGLVERARFNAARMRQS